MSTSSRQDAKAPRAQRTTENEIGRAVVDCAVKIHSDLGPGLMETVYEAILAETLSRAGYGIRRQVAIPLVYEGLNFKEAFRADIIVDDLVILELKAVDSISDAHRKQLVTYLKLSGKKLGFVLNFNVALMRQGIYRAVNNLEE